MSISQKIKMISWFLFLLLEKRIMLQIKQKKFGELLQETNQLQGGRLLLGYYNYYYYYYYYHLNVKIFL